MIRKDFLPHHEELQVIQDDDMFLINSDTMVLGEFIDLKHKDNVCDFGTNQGALLLYASLFKPKRLITSYTGALSGFKGIPSLPPKTTSNVPLSK